MLNAGNASVNHRPQMPHTMARWITLSRLNVPSAMRYLMNSPSVPNRNNLMNPITKGWSFVMAPKLCPSAHAPKLCSKPIALITTDVSPEA
jgi:hypothetical protein